MPNDRKEIQIAAHENQIIVDLNDLAGIQDLLNSSRVSWERIEKCTRLRLALITLRDLGNIPAGHKDRKAFSELDRLISYLKKSYRKKHGGRTPLRPQTMPKSRAAPSLQFCNSDRLDRVAGPSILRRSIFQRERPRSDSV